MNGYEKRTKQKKDSILEIATKLFIERGITNVSISEISTKAGVSQVSIYNYFGDKNNLAREAFISYIKQVVREYEELLDRDIPFSEKIEQIMCKKHNAILELSHSDFSQQAMEDKAFRQLYKEAASIQAQSVYGKFIQVGKKAGAIDPSLSDDALLTFLLSSASIMHQPDYYKKSIKYKENILNLFLYGLLGKHH
ncbi:TetR/AcrR family transcriptional regulator [Clostridium sp. MT-14]|uniref:TetR/AcrR family transcriptional regulator n=1 Tax=Clostridium aromativorans TaxID=2836848 RepID=A0ABS8N994_9CLOT|nr:MULTISPECIES: TetR/AcrR family transcriptional regulator [Clostridium]MCC9296221.1 TetR/AcrR family transcriptional regulator [Clostridium aromativorans]MCI1946148.1 TetR/AcrR family transcriptional regulator [Clostridium luticellarii]